MDTTDGFTLVLRDICLAVGALSLSIFIALLVLVVASTFVRPRKPAGPPTHRRPVAPTRSSPCKRAARAMTPGDRPPQGSARCRSTTHH